MAFLKVPNPRIGVAAAAACFAGTLLAQTAPPQVITITGKSRSNTATVAGFGELPSSSLPMSASVISTVQLQDAGIGSLADITRLDAGITDAYNPPGYWSQLAVRGFTLDNRFNYRRDGLPINAETAIAQDNKGAMEILKGTSGLQAGTSAPGGLVNLVVKRPQAAVRSVVLRGDAGGAAGVALDVGDRANGFGWRINAGADRLDPPARSARGSRRLLAGAIDVQPAPGSLLQAEVELAHQSQPSVPGFSLLGQRLPAAKNIDPRTSLNNQPWSLPVVFDGRTASLRYTHTLTDSIELVVHGMQQRLRTDDRVAFPSGCSAEDNYDRYCSNGSFDLYDFRSDNERRSSTALDAFITGSVRLAGITHRFNVGALSTRFKSRFDAQTYNYVGTGSIDGNSRTPSDPAQNDLNTDRNESSTELHLQDMLQLANHTRLWVGLRHTQLQRASVRIDGSRRTDYSQGFTTPWLALSQSLGSDGTVYLSWGQGVESEVAPNRNRYTNAGQALPALKSRQVEAGYKHTGSTVDWRMAAFDIRRPEWRDIGVCNTSLSCTRRADGGSRHSGLEAEAEWRNSTISLRASALVLKARREGSNESTLNGLRPTNVPATSLKLQAAYNVPALPGLALLGFVTHEGERMVLPDNSISTPGWTRVDLALRYTQRLPSLTSLTWRLGVDNLADTRAWKESPFQYGHAYLYPLAPRTVHASVNAGF